MGRQGLALPVQTTLHRVGGEGVCTCRGRTEGEQELSRTRWRPAGGAGGQQAPGDVDTRTQQWLSEVPSVCRGWMEGQSWRAGSGARRAGRQEGVAGAEELLREPVG